MEYKIELYRGFEQTFFGTIPFMPVVQQSLEQLLGRDLNGATIHVVVLNVPEEAFSQVHPIIENALPEYGYAYIKVYQDGYLLYQHPHPLSEIIVPTLRLVLREEVPDEVRWAFRVDLPGLPRHSMVRPAPLIQGEVIVQSYTAGEKPAFAIRRVVEEEPPLMSLDEFAISVNDVQKHALVKVLVPRTLEDNLLQERPFSKDVEEGGFLIGKVFRDADHPGSHLVVVNDALIARYTGASLLHFTFTGDSFIEAKQMLREQQPGDRITGWYHTHLFAATPDFGLSSIDFRLHFSTFTFPWQVAGLINIDGNGRVLRFYAPHNDDMQLCPYWVINERY